MKLFLFKDNGKHLIVETSSNFKDMCAVLRAKGLGDMRCVKELEDMIEAVLAEEKFKAMWLIL